MTVDLSLSPDTIRMLIQKARSVFSATDDNNAENNESGIEFDTETLSDTHAHDGLRDEETEDLSEEELRELIDDLNVDESAELVAIAWIGRGDYDAADFETAVEEARERAIGSTTKYLIGMPLLADYLEAGLDALEL